MNAQQRAWNKYFDKRRSYLCTHLIKVDMLIQEDSEVSFILAACIYSIELSVAGFINTSQYNAYVAAYDTYDWIVNVDIVNHCIQYVE